MLRFRNRFTAAPSLILTCHCGRRLTYSGADGRQTIIHELPWCDRFEGLMKKLQAEPGAQLHQAAIYATESGVETVLTADGDRFADVDTIPNLRHRGDA